MTRPIQYIPILKARDAELAALSTAPGSLGITPLFELQPTAPASRSSTSVPTRSKSAMTDASYFLDDVARQWKDPLYLDVSRVAPVTHRAPWWYLVYARCLFGAFPSGTVMPVVHDVDTTSDRQAARPLAKLADRAALRLSLPFPNLKAVAALMTAVAADLDLAPQDIDLVLDWKDELEPKFISLDNAEAHSLAVIAAFGGQHGRISLAGTPNSSDFVQAGDWSVTRREWWLWLRLQAAGIEITYGDYALYPPTDPVQAAPKYGHLRYSSGDRLHVHRRPIPRTGGGLGGAFRACCAHLVTEPHFLGATFSLADQQIADVAAGRKVMGAAGSWRQLAQVHHFALVANQLAAPPPAPIPGTP